MGQVEIPPDPSSAGKLSCSLLLEGDEISVLNERLKAVLHHLVENKGLFVAAAPAGPSSHAAGLASGMSAVSISSGPSTSAASTGAPRAAAPAGIPALSGTGALAPGFGTFASGAPGASAFAPQTATPVSFVPPIVRAQDAGSSFFSSMPAYQAPPPPQPAAPAPPPAWPAPAPVPAPMPIPVPMPVPLPTPAPVPTPVPVTVQPAWQATAVPQPQPQQPQQSQHQVQRPTASASISAAPVASALPGWEVVTTTQAAEHNSQAVLALAYCPSLEGLPGGDGHAGWLISSSQNVLNLWEANAGGRSDDNSSLMLMHGQHTDLLSSHLSAEGAISSLYAVSLDIGSQAECISVHSLKVDSMLAYKYRLTPPADVPAVPGATPAGPSGGRSGAGGRGGRGAAAPQLAKKGRSLSRVQSLHSLGRFFRQHLVAAQGPNVLMYELPAQAAHAPISSVVGLQPKRSWRAHDGSPTVAVSALSATSLSGGLLFTGATDGSVNIWNLSDRPGTKIRSLKCDKTVTALHLTNDTTLVTSSTDGKVLIWDMRRPDQPTRSVVPDGSPALGLELSPAGDCVAVSTVQGLYAMDLLDGGGLVTPIVRGLGKPYHAITWNAGTSELYAAAASGVITVYRQRGI